MPNEELLSKSQIELAFRRLAERMREHGEHAEIYVFGGACMVLGYSARGYTHDVDVHVEAGFRGVEVAAREVAKELNLPSWWLNEQATSYLPRIPDTEAKVAYEYPNLVVKIASPQHMLAMKLAGSRRADIQDIRVLMEHLGMSSRQDLLDTWDAIFPGELLNERAMRVVNSVEGPGWDTESGLQ